LSSSSTTGRAKLQRLDAVEVREWPRIEPGTYRARCRDAWIEFSHQYGRWCCFLLWEVLADDGVSVLARVPQWLRLGEGEKPHPSPSGKFWAVWVAANGAEPKRGDRMAAKVFRDRVAKVEVGDSARTAREYSKVTSVLAFLPSLSAKPAQAEALSHARAEGGKRKADQEPEHGSGSGTRNRNTERGKLKPPAHDDDELEDVTL
jgi:hypothetical protein